MIMSYKDSIYTGTSNIVLPVPNKLLFPPDYQDKSRLCYYASLFNSLEAMVIHDMPKSSTPFIDSDVPFVFLRFHGPNGGYRGSYTDEHLAEYASYITNWQDEGKTIFAYFNNTMGDALQNLITLNRMIGI
jgi:uncharacterized protein YecE (DUF72 family)